MAGIGQLPDHIAPVWAFGGGDFIIVRLGVELAEAVVMPAGEDEILHARSLGGGHPRVRVEPGRVELFVEVVINLDRDLRAARLVSASLAAARPADLGAFEAHRPPVDEQAKPRLAPPFYAFGNRRCAGRGFGGSRLRGVE